MADFKTKYKYIHFTLEPENGPDVWLMRNNKDKDQLGRVAFYQPWREWVLYDVGWEVVLSSSCLVDIKHFLDQLNEKKEAEL